MSTAEIDHGTPCKGCGVNYIKPCHGLDPKCPNKRLAEIKTPPKEKS